jgi:hypothetical protein
VAWDQRARPASEYIHPKKRQRELARHGRICHLCGHGGADQVDHVIPWGEWARTDLNVHDESNLRPAHGSPCPTCGRSCHDDKTKAEAARGRARATARRAAQGRRPTEPHPGALTTRPHATTR